MAALASDWLRHFRLLLWNRWTEFNETWQQARSQCPLPSLWFSVRSEKQNGRPCLWLAETFSTSPKTLNGIQRNVTGSKISMSSTKFVFFGSIGKTRWPPWSLIGIDIFDFSSETAERNSTKLDRKQDRNVLYQVCLFWADRKKQNGRPGLWLAETISTSPLKPLNGIQRNFTRSKIPTSLSFSCRSEKQDCCPGLWLAEIFSTSLKPLNGFQRNLTWSKISTSSTKFVFFGPISKQKGPLWSIPLKGGTLYSGARYVAIWASCLAHMSRRFKWAIVIARRPSGINFHIFDFSSETATLNSGRSEKQNGHPFLWLAETFSTSPTKLLNGIQRNLTASKISKSSTKFVFFGSIGKTRWPPWSLIGIDIFDFLTNLVEESCFLSSFVELRSAVSEERPPWPLISWDIFDY